MENVIVKMDVRGFIRFPEEAVKALKLDQDANAPAYNLGGQKVSTTYRGLVIKNGRKFMVK